MTTFAEDILFRFCEHLDEDSIKLFDKRNDTKNARSPLGAGKGERKRFASLLVSVATHPIGLKASVSPFNCEKEQMLAYLMGMFNLNQAQLEKMLIGGTEASPKSPATFKKKHSWRPEIKFRLGPPVFQEKPKEYMDNLTVRVYLFRERPLTNAKRKSISPTRSTSPTSGSKTYLGFFDIMERTKLNQSTLIRPANEMRLELKFISDNEEGSYKAVLKTKYQESTGSRIDTRINVRRHYAESDSAYILRFEFWLNNKVLNMGKFRRLTRYIIHSNACCLFKRDRPSTYLSENKLLYGYININLTHIPSYATKRSYPIMSIRGRNVNSSEIGIEFRNRQLIDADEGYYDMRLPATQKRDDAQTTSKQVNDDFIVNHLRLYADCFIYQISLLKLDELINSNDLDRLTSSITFDNLIYLPAHTLINQHRLQSNLRPLEDQSLRRSAILLLLIKLADHSKLSKKNPLKLAILLLISIVQHEYLVGHRLFDSKTMQEIEVFDDELSMDNSRESIVEVENLAIVGFFKKFISHEQLSDEWLKNISSTTLNLGKAITLASLRLVKCVLAHYKTNKLVNLIQRHNVLKLEVQVEQLLTDVITRDIRSNLYSLLSAGCAPTLSQNAQVKLRRNFRAKREKKTTIPATKNATGVNSWQQIASYTQRIDHDLSLHWSIRGFDCLALDSSKLLEPMSSSKGLNGAKSLNSTIKAKVSRYLAEKGS